MAVLLASHACALRHLGHWYGYCTRSSHGFQYRTNTFAGVPLLFWLIIFLKRRNGLEDKLLLIDHPSNSVMKERLMREMRQDLLDQGRYLDESTIKMLEKDLLVDYMQNARLTVSCVLSTTS